MRHNVRANARPTTVRNTIFVAACAAVVVLLVLSAGPRWRYGVWLPVQRPRVIEHNGWRYASSEEDFDTMVDALIASGIDPPDRSELRPSPEPGTPAFWTVYVAPDEADERYPETVFVRTPDGVFHPYGYRGMPPSE